MANVDLWLHGHVYDGSTSQPRFDRFAVVAPNIVPVQASTSGGYLRLIRRLMMLIFDKIQKGETKSSAHGETANFK